ncbi:hypothetical protein AQY21_21480 [Paracoccus sp. MKU1]|nr:hypothetical protein AQY21_21480 [Paracoccus sp. MKU1]
MRRGGGLQPQQAAITIQATNGVPVGTVALQPGAGAATPAPAIFRLLQVEIVAAKLAEARALDHQPVGVIRSRP